MTRRAKLERLIVSDAGDIQQGAQVTLYEIDDYTLLAQTMYDSASGGSVVANPLISDETGRVLAYVDAAQRAVARLGTQSFDVEFAPDPTMARARVTYSGSQNLPDDTQTFLDFTTVVWDNDSIYSGSQTKRLTCQTPGLYHIEANVSIGTATSGNAYISITKNVGRTKIAQDGKPVQSSGATDCHVSTNYELAAGDYVEVSITMLGAGVTATVANSQEYGLIFAMSQVGT